jgi:hypothetical protein
MTYTSWREQKQAELISNEVRKYLEILHRLESFEFTVVDRINYETSLIDLIDEYSLFLQKFSDTGFFLQLTFKQDLEFESMHTNLLGQCMKYRDNLRECKNNLGNYDHKKRPKYSDYQEFNEYMIRFVLYDK